MDKPDVNRSSTGRLVPPSVSIGFRLFVLPKSRSQQLSSMPRKAKGTVVFWANRPVGVPSYSAPPRRSAVRRPAPTRPWYVWVLDSTSGNESDRSYVNFQYVEFKTRIPHRRGWARRGTAEHGGAAGRSGAGRGRAGQGHGGAVCQGDDLRLRFPDQLRQTSWRFFRKHNQKGNPM